MTPSNRKAVGDSGLAAADAVPDGAVKASSDPFLIQGPALISFSGGRTSAYMLWRILQAHGGTLPPDVVVAFANTGKEREETLRFVYECGSRWGVRIHWLEWRPKAKQPRPVLVGANVSAWMHLAGWWDEAVERCGDAGFEEVGFNSAARNGAPFEGLIALRGRLPNPLQRFCSRELKVEPIKALCRSLGWERWANVIGLRHDEGWRVMKKYAENDNGGHRWKSAMPLAKAKITKRDVLAFWAEQPFDLGLQQHEGNCDLCFLKSAGKLDAIIRDRPDLAQWWVAQEANGNRFERARSYADMVEAARRQPDFFDDNEDEHDAECGLWCAADGEAA